MGDTFSSCPKECRRCVRIAATSTGSDSRDSACHVEAYDISSRHSLLFTLRISSLSRMHSMTDFWSNGNLNIAHYEN
jgi:hypothetical protein